MHRPYREYSEMSLPRTAESSNPNRRGLQRILSGQILHSSETPGTSERQPLLGSDAPPDHCENFLRTMRTMRRYLCGSCCPQEEVEPSPLPTPPVNPRPVIEPEGSQGSRRTPAIDSRTSQEAAMYSERAKGSLESNAGPSSQRRARESFRSDVGPSSQESDFRALSRSDVASPEQDLCNSLNVHTSEELKHHIGQICHRKIPEILNSIICFLSLDVNLREERSQREDIKMKELMNKQSEEQKKTMDNFLDARKRLREKEDSILLSFDQYQILQKKRQERITKRQERITTKYFIERATRDLDEMQKNSKDAAMTGGTVGSGTSRISGTPRRSQDFYTRKITRLEGEVQTLSSTIDGLDREIAALELGSEAQPLQVEVNQLQVEVDKIKAEVIGKVKEALEQDLEICTLEKERRNAKEEMLRVANDVEGQIKEKNEQQYNEYLAGRLDILGKKLVSSPLSEFEQALTTFKTQEYAITTQIQATDSFYAQGHEKEVYEVSEFIAFTTALEDKDGQFTKMHKKGLEVIGGQFKTRHEKRLIIALSQTAKSLGKALPSPAGKDGRPSFTTPSLARIKEINDQVISWLTDESPKLEDPEGSKKEPAPSMPRYATRDGKIIQVKAWQDAHPGKKSDTYETTRDFLKAQKLEGKIIIIPGHFTRPDYNCHSYTFTREAIGWLHDNYINDILTEKDFQIIGTGCIERNTTDNSSSFSNRPYFHGKGIIVHYNPVPETSSAQVDDIILYYKLNERNEKIYMHSGIVFRVDNDCIMIKSKWGGHGLYGHNIFDVPEEYGPFFDILHSENSRFLDREGTS